MFKNKRRKIKLADCFTIASLCTTWALIALPEMVYVKDIYIESHKRSNTMFKLTYQAFVLSYISSGYILVRTLSLIKSKKIKFAAALLGFAIPIFLVMLYPPKAIKTYYNNLRVRQGLAGDAWLRKSYPNTYLAYKWLSKLPGQPVILEAQGDSYTKYNVLSAYTGLPTVNGWFVHEWLWRGNSQIPQKRSSDVEKIYSSREIGTAKQLIRKYNIEYIILSDFEREKYKNINEALLYKLGSVVFQSGNLLIIKVNT